jgi:hypothetical protein
MQMQNINTRSVLASWTNDKGYKKSADKDYILIGAFVVAGAGFEPATFGL